MDVFVARQPILDNKRQLVGYEMLYRDGPENVFPKHVNGSEATMNMLNNTHLNQGLGAFIQDKIGLINFTQSCLLEGLPTMLPPEKVVVEILESVEPNDEVFAACKGLFDKGYKLALDDFVYSKDWHRFLPFIKLIKIDLDETSFEQLGKLMKVVKESANKNISRIRFLVERVETEDQFARATAMGVDYFQGYFFARPTVLRAKGISPHQVLLLSIYNEVMSPNMDVGKLEVLFKQDPGITYKLLAYINTGNFQLKQEISTIKAALVYLGTEQLQRFISMMVTSGLNPEKPGHLVEEALFRARFCELIAEKCCPNLVQNAFFAGLLSMLDVLLDRPMKDVLKNVAVSPSILQALTSKEKDITDSAARKLRDMLNLVVIHETGKWRGLKPRCQRLQIDEAQVPILHAEALSWLSDFVKQSNLKHTKVSMLD